MAKPIYKRKKAITVPLFRHNVGETCYMEFLGKVRFVHLKDGKGKDKEAPAACFLAVNLIDDTNGQVEYIAPSLVQEAFKRDLGLDLSKLDTELVHDIPEIKNKSYEIITSKREGKRYHDVTMYEIEQVNLDEAPTPDQAADEWDGVPD